MSDLAGMGIGASGNEFSRKVREWEKVPQCINFVDGNDREGAGGNLAVMKDIPAHFYTLHHPFWLPSIRDKCERMS